MAGRGSSSSKDKVSEKGKEIGKDVCLHCGAAVKQGENGIQCELCEAWSHAKCENINEEGYKILKLENIHWYCVGCNKGVGRVLTNMMKMQQSHEKLEKEVRDIQANSKQYQSKVDTEIEKIKGGMEIFKQDVKSVKEVINELTATLEQQKEEQKNIESNESLWSTIVGKHVEKKMETVTVEMLEVQKTIIEAKEHMNEEKDKEKRRQNIIIYRAVESQATGPETRKNEDQRFCLALVQDVLEVDCTSDDIDSVRRLGKRQDGTCRPMLVSFKSVGVKNQVMESLSKLAEADDKYRTLSITHDMTQKEREECKTMVAQAKHKQEEDASGEYIYRVRGAPGELKVVRLRKRYQPGGNSQQAGVSQ